MGVMSRSMFVLPIWVIIAVAVAVVWMPLSWTRSGNRLVFDIDVLPLLALIMITIAASVLYRRFKRSERMPDSDKSGASENE
jgi:hypothetical protein